MREKARERAVVVGERWAEAEAEEEEEEEPAPPVEVVVVVASLEMMMRATRSLSAGGRARKADLRRRSSSHTASLSSVSKQIRAAKRDT
jgi:hypothetical protein